MCQTLKKWTKKKYFYASEKENNNKFYVGGWSFTRSSLPNHAKSLLGCHQWSPPIKLCILYK